MFCCRSKKDYYVVEEGDGDENVKEQEEKPKGGKKSKKTDKVKVNEANDVSKEKDIIKETEEVVESPIEVRITEACESVPLDIDKGEDKSGDVVAPADECKKEQTFETQTSVTSQQSVRESINQSRENFFSCNSLNESHLQEVRKSLSSTDERFTEHCRKLRSQLSSGSGEGGQGHVMSYEQMQQAISRLEAAAARLEALSVVGGGKAPSGSEEVEAAPFMAAYDEIANGKLAQFMKLSENIGGDVKTQADIAKAGFDALRNLMVTASKSKKPAQTVLIELLKPLSEKITAVQEFKDANRASKSINHLQTLAESIPALAWVSVEPAPRAYVKDMSDAGQFYSNRVIKEYKGKEDQHVEWARAWHGIWTETIDYIKEYHTTGLSWNPKGGDASAAAKSAAPPPPAGGPPAPPPPPPAPAPAPPSQASTGGDADDRAKLFESINRGEAITSGLKKVTDDMKTHKNPGLKLGSTVSAVRTGPKPFAPTKPTGPVVAPKPQPVADKPPVFELQEKKWMVEYQVGNKSLVIDDTNLKQVVYVYKCRDSTIQVKGKVNSITLDSCKKVAVAFDSVVSCIDVVNSQSVQAQVFGKCPTVSIDKTDGFQMYLSQDSLDTQIVTAKSSEMNILVPKEDGDFGEFALPEQFKTVWNGKKFTTECTESV